MFISAFAQFVGKCSLGGLELYKPRRIFPDHNLFKLTLCTLDIEFAAINMAIRP